VSPYTYALMGASGSPDAGRKDSRASAERLKFLARLFKHAVWLNPKPESEWRYNWTIGEIGKIYPMFELTLDGLEKAVQHMMKRH
jgi:uncharacterized protein